MGILYFFRGERDLGFELIGWGTVLCAQSRFFDNDPNKVPRMALTVGVATVLEAREIGKSSTF
jgi:6-phosphogluconolactonase/glucosamine-6-phosphate isomerase/deaminase